MKYILAALLITLLLSTNFAGQSPAVDEPGCATEQSKSLNFLVGTWKVRSNFRVSRSENKWETTEAVSRISHLFENCIYQEILTGKRDDRPHQFTGLFSYNNLSNKLQWAGGHSEHGVLTLYEGNFVDDELVLESQLFLRSNLVYFRIVFTKTETGFNVRSERSRDKKLWDAGWYRSYTRKE